MVRRVAVLVYLGVTFIAVPQATAAITIGESYSSSGGEACNYGGTEIQTASDGNSYAAPYDGVITSWSNQGSFWPTITFKVARLGTGGAYTVVGSDGPRTVAAGNEKETYPVRIPVRQGDVIGARIPVGDYTCVHGGGTYVFGRDDADTPVGSSGVFDGSASGQLPVEAVIERDADGDGYGDETQDECPTNAATAGPCPLPTTLGQTFTPVPSGATFISTNVVTGSIGVVSNAQRDGVITSWSFQAGTDVDGTVKLKMLRPLGGSDYRVVDAAAPQVPVASTLNTFPTRIPVREGDRIGIGTENISVTSNASSQQNSMAGILQDVPPGASATFTPTGAVGRRVDVSAALEADSDGDGYGDTSQDLCPTDASTQGQCPVLEPPPGDDPTCVKAENKLDKAKAKLKRLKRNDAAAKKAKAAKQKVKKAKSEVRDAC